MNRGNSAVTLAGPPIRLNFVSCVIQVHAEETFPLLSFFFLFVFICDVLYSGELLRPDLGWAGTPPVPPSQAAHVLVLGADDTLTQFTLGKFMFFKYWVVLMPHHVI